MTVTKHLTTESDIEEWLRPYAPLGFRDSRRRRIKKIRAPIFNTKFSLDLKKVKIWQIQLLGAFQENMRWCSFSMSYVPVGIMETKKRRRSFFRYNFKILCVIFKGCLRTNSTIRSFPGGSVSLEDHKNVYYILKKYLDKYVWFWSNFGMKFWCGYNF